MMINKRRIKRYLLTITFSLILVCSGCILSIYQGNMYDRNVCIIYMIILVLGGSVTIIELRRK